MGTRARHRAAPRARLAASEATGGVAQHTSQWRARPGRSVVFVPCALLVVVFACGSPGHADAMRTPPECDAYFEAHARCRRAALGSDRSDDHDARVRASLESRARVGASELEEVRQQCISGTKQLALACQ